jgi:predicted nucleotide-binding protein
MPRPVALLLAGIAREPLRRPPIIGTVTAAAKPVRVFIGSSTEGREIALNLQEQLERTSGCEVDLWEHVFDPSGYALPSLLAAADKVDFAVLVATPDDTTISRGVAQEAVRDNIILEFGLFAGVLGLDRTYLLPTGDDVKLPSDVFGLTRLNYRKRTDGRIPAALTSAVLSIKGQLDSLGPRIRAVKPQVDPDALTEAEFDEVEEIIHEKRRMYSTASAFYRSFENGRWLKGFKLPPRFRTPSAEMQLKERWIREADFTRSWDHSNTVFMQLQVVADHITMEELDHLLDLPTTDDYGNDQQAGLDTFLKYIQQNHPEALSPKAIERLERLEDDGTS